MIKCQVYGEEVGSGLMIFYLFLAFSGFLLVSLIVTILYITFANKVRRPCSSEWFSGTKCTKLNIPLIFITFLSQDQVLLIDTGEEDWEEKQDEKSESFVHQKWEKDNQWMKVLRNSGLSLVHLCRIFLHFPFSIYEYFKLRFDSNIISLS